MTLYVKPIVEGETECRCLKTLLSRIWRELIDAEGIEPLAVLEPIPANRGSLVRDGHAELAERVELAVRLLGAATAKQPESRGGVLILLDADEDCPARLGPRLLERAREIRSDADIACVIAKRELENWFKAAAASLAGIQGLLEDLQTPHDPEVGAGDRWLTRQMQRRNPKRKYTKPADAEELARRLDLQECRSHAPSFDKLCRELECRRPAPPESGTPAAENGDDPPS